MSKFFKQKQGSVPRTTVEIRQDYTQVCNQIGQLEHQLKKFPEQIDELHEHASRLDEEYKAAFEREKLSAELKQKQIKQPDAQV